MPLKCYSILIFLKLLNSGRGVNGTQPLFIANEEKVVSLEDDFMRLTRRCTIEDSKITMRRVLLSFLVQSEVLLRMEVGGILLVCVERVSILKIVHTTVISV